MGEFIKIDCITGNSYFAEELPHQMFLPKSATLYECGQEISNDDICRTFTIYKKISKKGNKYYIIFSKYF